MQLLILGSVITIAIEGVLALESMSNLAANELAFTLLGYFMIRQPGSSGIKKRNFDETEKQACALGA